MNCPVCLKDEWAFLRRNKNNGRDYVYCKYCGKDVIRLDPLINTEADIYNKPYPKNMVNDESYNAWQLAQLEEFGLPEYDLFLEIGCGIGGLALKLAKMGKIVEVIERNPHARQFCKEHGLKAYSTYNDVQICGGYDVCYSFHYLEHILNLKVDIALQCSLADYVFFCIPTGQAELDNPDHNWLLSSRALVNMLQQSGKTILQSKLSTYQLDWKDKVGEITFVLIPGNRSFLAPSP